MDLRETEREEPLRQVGPKNMSLQIYVDAYSGFRANERPRLFQVDDDLYPIESIESQWKTPEALYFKVRVSNGKRYLLRWLERTDEWFLQSDYDGRELFERRRVQFIPVDAVRIREAESRIAGCEACRGDEAHLLFDWILADVPIKHGAYEFILSSPATCPGCRGLLTEKSWVEPQGGIEVQAEA